MEKISFAYADTDESAEFYVLEQTRINGKNYILVTDSEEDSDEDAQAFILKDMSLETEEEALYEMVDDIEELEAVSKIFSEILEDIDISL